MLIKTLGIKVSFHSERLKIASDEPRRIASGRLLFQARGPATAKARSPIVERLQIISC